MDFDLDDEQRMLIDTVRGFVEKELYPHEALVDRLNEVPAEVRADVVAKSQALGLYAANMPAEHGGAELDDLCFTLLERELGRASWALQWLVARPSNILKACQGEQIERYLLPCIRGEKIDCLAMTEPNAGSDPCGCWATSVLRCRRYAQPGLRARPTCVARGTSSSRASTA